jgi:hypothetical protein
VRDGGWQDGFQFGRKSPPRPEPGGRKGRRADAISVFDMCVPRPPV